LTHRAILRVNKNPGNALFIIALLSRFMANAQQPDPPGQVIPGESPRNEAYLFAHMTHFGIDN